MTRADSWTRGRRRLLRLGGLGLAWAMRPARAAEALPADLLFDVYRKGSLIGTSDIRFRAEAEGFTATTVMELAVKLAFITVFRFRQEARELWQGGRLVRSDVVTDDDGRVTHVEVRPTGDELTVEGPRGIYRVPAGTMTDLGFWNPAIINARAIVDGQHGELMPLRLIPPVEETVTVAGRAMRATRYGFIATQTQEGTAREGTVWYDRGGRWVRCELLTRGERLTLELRSL